MYMLIVFNNSLTITQHYNLDILRTDLLEGAVWLKERFDFSVPTAGLKRRVETMNRQVNHIANAIGTELS